MYELSIVRGEGLRGRKCRHCLQKTSSHICMFNEYDKARLTFSLIPCLIEEKLPPLRSFCLIRFDHTSHIYPA